MEKESPTIEEPKEENVDDAQALMEELKRLDIQSPQDVQNMAVASREAGKAWNEVGNLRSEVDRLTKMLQQQPKEQEYYNDGETLDLGKVVRKEVTGVLSEYLQNQQRAQLASMKVMSEVKADPDYHAIGDVFEKYINTPDAVMKLQTGQSDYKTEWMNTKAAYYRNLAQRSAKQMEKLIGTNKQTPPHIEQGESQTSPSINRDDQKTEDFKNITKARKEGAINPDQALEKIIKSVMPDLENDPSFYMP